jgi:hypothetical protein
MLPLIGLILVLLYLISPDFSFESKLDHPIKAAASCLGKLWAVFHGMIKQAL